MTRVKVNRWAVLRSMRSHPYRFTSTVWINGFRYLELTYDLAAKMRAYCEIPGNREVRIRKERGRDDCPQCLLLISEVRTGHKPRVGEGVDSAVPPLDQHNLCKVGIFKGQPGHSP